MSTADAADPFGGELKASASALPRDLREALAQALARGEALAIARFDPASARLASTLYGLVALVALAGWAALLARGYGEPGSPRAAASTLALHVASASPAMVMLVAFARTVRAAAVDADHLPLPPGTYLLARGILVATAGGELVVIPLTPAPPSLAFDEAGTSLVVRRADGSELLRTAKLAEVSPGAIARVAARADGAGARAFERLVAHARGSTTLRERRAHPFRGLVLGALGGAALAGGAFVLRNTMSDARAFRRAVAEATADPAPLVLYATAGGRRANEVWDDLLPRRELARLVGEGTPEALDAFVAEHEGHPVAEEARRARAAVIHREFTTCDTVHALREFIRRFPGAEDAPAASTKMHALYTEARRAIRSQARAVAGGDPDAPVVLDALLAWLEAHGSPTVTVRFRGNVAPSLARADELLERGLLDDDGPARGGKAPAAARFDARHARERERVVMEALDASLAKELSPGILHLAAGEPLPAVTATALPERVSSLSRPAPSGPLRAPTLNVDYEVAWSGRTYVGREGGRRFVGVAFHFFVVLAVPGEDATLELETRVEPEATFSAAAADDDAIYDGMARRAFDQLAVRFRERAFGAR